MLPSKAQVHLVLAARLGICIPRSCTHHFNAEQDKLPHLQLGLCLYQIVLCVIAQTQLENEIETFQLPHL